MHDHTSNDVDLLGLGEHCSLSSCNVRDFLPFKCLGCGGCYCLEHRANHSCPSAAQDTGAGQVIVCPICAKGVRLAPGKDANEAFEEHSRSSGCDPSNYSKVNHKPRCPVGRCQEKLTLTNTYRCKKCNLRICLKHRDPADHNCGSQLRPPPSTYTAAPSSSNQQSHLPRPSPPPASAPPTSYHAPAASSKAESLKLSSAHDDPIIINTVKGTAERRKNMVNGINPLHSSPQETRSLNEACPMCSARFAFVERLIQHVDEFHPPQQPQPAAAASHSPPPSLASGGIRGSSAYQYRCEFCQRGFHEAVDVLHHSERCPIRGAGNPKSKSASTTCEIS